MNKDFHKLAPLQASIGVKKCIKEMCTFINNDWATFCGVLCVVTFFNNRVSRGIFATVELLV